VTSPEPFVFGTEPESKRHAPATLRNRDAILEVLRAILPASGVVLEIASGTGEHIVHFAGVLRQLTFQPSDPAPEALTSIVAWLQESRLENVLSPVCIDASAPDWPVTRADAILCINMVHISPWAATEGLFAAAASLLPADAPLYLYGPYREAGVPTAESNEAFDQSLKARDPQWGLRHVEDMTALATAHGFTLDQRIVMPANNLSLVFRKIAG
jgi:hypothetical protein